MNWPAWPHAPAQLACSTFCGFALTAAVKRKAEQARTEHEDLEHEHSQPACAQSIKQWCGIGARGITQRDQPNQPEHRIRADRGRDRACHAKRCRARRCATERPTCGSAPRPDRRCPRGCPPPNAPPAPRASLDARYALSAKSSIPALSLLTADAGCASLYAECTRTVSAAVYVRTEDDVQMQRWR